MKEARPNPVALTNDAGKFDPENAAVSWTLPSDWYYEPSEQEQSFMDWFSNILASEDIGLCEKVQKGLHSRGYQQGKFVVAPDHVEYSEHHVHFFQRLVYRALTGKV